MPQSGSSFLRRQCERAALGSGEGEHAATGASRCPVCKGGPLRRFLAEGLTRGKAGTDSRRYMARVHIRIVAALLALAVLTVTVLGAFYMYRENMQPEQERKKEITSLMKHQGPKIDPGKKIHDQAMQLIRNREMDAARQRLTEITDVYRDSERYAQARAVLGEMNMDRLFARTPMPGKLEYPVANKDRLNALATKFRTTIAYIQRVNNLVGTVIHPGDRLIVYPLDFEVEVELENKRLTVMKDGRFFKDYSIVGHHLPFPNLSKETTIAEVYGWQSDKKIRPDSDQYPGAQKWVQTAGRGSRSGIIFCPEPPAPAAGAQPSPAGIYLSAEDMQELSTILRPGIPLRFLKTTKSTS